jgi:uncharacterized protein involved in response to NO
MTHHPVDTERSFAAPAGSRWRSEPFRLFFPLGVLLGWVGVGHWLLYATGATQSYSCLRHGLVQMQAFMMAFAAGFLLTALPRRTSSAPPSALEMTIVAVSLVTTTAALVQDRWIVAQASYLVLFLLLLAFAARRFLLGGARRRPPAAFVLVPLGVAQGIAGAILLMAHHSGAAGAWGARLGQLLIEQGVFLCLVMGIGSLILPLMAGAAPPADLGSSPRETAKALAYLSAGLLVVASLIAEAAGAERLGPLVRAVVVALTLGLGAGAWGPIGRPGLHRKLVRLAVWLMPAGLLLSAAFPDYRVPALHVLFIGGFGLMAFAVATHVVLAHLDATAESLGWPPAVGALALGILLAMAARVAADASETYFVHLGWAAGAWITGTLVWLGYVVPKILRG